MPTVRDDLWTWGYVMPTVPARVPCVEGASFCSLETAAGYLGAPNLFYLNSMHTADALREDLFAPLGGFRRIVCGLQHGNYAASARAIADWAQSHPAVTGALLDDFLSPLNPVAHPSVEEVAEIRRLLRSRNPALKLYVVLYTFMKPEVLLPYLDLIDGISLWCWVSTEHFWRHDYHACLVELRQKLRKDIVQGIFLHQYGDGMDILERTFPMPLDLLQLQSEKISAELRLGRLAGWCVLQNGWFSSQSHRPQVQWFRDFLDWHYGTTTRRPAGAGATPPA